MFHVQSEMNLKNSKHTLEAVELGADLLPFERFNCKVVSLLITGCSYRWTNILDCY